MVSKLKKMHSVMEPGYYVIEINILVQNMRRFVPASGWPVI